MAEYSKEFYKYFMAMIPFLSGNKKRKLINHFGEEKKVYKAPMTKLSSTGFITLTDVKNLQDFKSSFSEDIIEAQKKNGIKLITEDDTDYPESLKNIFNRPYGIFCKGNMTNITNPIAIVGSRNPSAYGRCAAEDISLALAENGATIISGMARGIDTAGHFGSLRKKTKTIAVLGSGVDVCYPKENQRVYEEIQKIGAVISEFPPGTSPLPINFPMRNRIISGLSKAVIVIEAKERSGSLITADFALEQGRDVFALPGRINDPLSLGCNQLIYQGAGIITSVEDLIRTLKETGILDNKNNEDDNSNSKNEPSGKNKKRKTPEEIVLKHIDYTPVGVDDLILNCKIPISELLNALWSLTESGIIKEEKKNVYVKNTL